MLAVRNIPGELNSITHLNGHFSRYGNLVNVQVRTDKKHIYINVNIQHCLYTSVICIFSSSVLYIGDILPMQVQFEGDPGSALVTFSSNEEAGSAFTTSEAVMNNRQVDSC